MNYHDESTVFMDASCPRCGNICGNGGQGDAFYCHNCGWRGKIDISPHDKKLIQDFIQRSREREIT